MSLPRGTVRSPNIWEHPAIYEVENHAVDRDGLIEQAMREVDDWAGREVLDLGCGSGFHLPRFAETASRVYGVEPHPGLLRLAARRTRSLATVSLLAGTAQAVPLPDASVDVAHARWAYFFGPGCEPGLAELDRVMRPGGRAFVIDNDDTRSTFGSWLHLGYPDRETAELAEFWAGQGWEAHPLGMAWTFDSREDLEAVVRIEFPAAAADEILASRDGLEVDYAITVWTREY